MYLYLQYRIQSKIIQRDKMKLLKILLGATLVAGQGYGNQWEQPSGKSYVEVDEPFHPRTDPSNLIHGFNSL